MTFTKTRAAAYVILSLRAASIQKQNKTFSPISINMADVTSTEYALQLLDIHTYAAEGGKFIQFLTKSGNVVP